MKEIVENTDDVNDLRIRLHIDIQIESFGITWEGQGIQKKKKKRDSKELNQLFRVQNEEMDIMLEKGYQMPGLVFKHCFYLLLFF